MNNQLGKVPFIHLVSNKDGMDYKFSFAGGNHYVPYKTHKISDYSELMRTAKNHAARVFYIHHYKKGRLPEIKVLQQSKNSFYCEFVHNDILYKQIYTTQDNDHTEALDNMIRFLLRMFNVDGLG